MLVLSRKAEQKIQIGEHVTITIVRVQGQTVKLGIEAPKDVRVLRAELKDAPARNRSTVPAADVPVAAIPVTAAITQVLLAAKGESPQAGPGNASGSSFPRQTVQFDLEIDEDAPCTPRRRIPGRKLDSDDPTAPAPGTGFAPFDAVDDEWREFGTVVACSPAAEDLRRRTD